jgi:hypothetical protein
VSAVGDSEPGAGARVTLKLQDTGPDTVSYACSVLQEGARFEGVARIRLPEGGIAYQGLEGAPEWIRSLVQGLLRNTWRSSEELGWPRRITRWRKRHTE